MPLPAFTPAALPACWSIDPTSKQASLQTAPPDTRNTSTSGRRGRRPCLACVVRKSECSGIRESCVSVGKQQLDHTYGSKPPACLPSTPRCAPPARGVFRRRRLRPNRSRSETDPQLIDPTDPRFIGVDRCGDRSFARASAGRPQGVRIWWIRSRRRGGLDTDDDAGGGRGGRFEERGFARRRRRHLDSAAFASSSLVPIPPKHTTHPIDPPHTQTTTPNTGRTEPTAPTNHGLAHPQHHHAPAARPRDGAR